ALVQLVDLLKDNYQKPLHSAAQLVCQIDGLVPLPLWAWDHNVARLRAAENIEPIEQDEQSKERLLFVFPLHSVFNQPLQKVLGLLRTEFRCMTIVISDGINSPLNFEKLAFFKLTHAGYSSPLSLLIAVAI